jgi:hypothetical protein
MNVVGKWINRLQTFGKRRSFGLNNLDIKLEKYVDFDNGFLLKQVQTTGSNKATLSILESTEIGADCLSNPSLNLP